MNRDLVINILLILAGIVLALALFGAGVLWKSRAPTKTSGLVKPQASETTNNDCYWITGQPEVIFAVNALTQVPRPRPPHLAPA